MERELYRTLYVTTHSLARGRRGKHVQYADWKIVVVFAWAVLHDRPVCWACDRRNWPQEAGLLQLPSASTMSRRLRRRSVQQLLDDVHKTLRRQLPQSEICIIDGKPLPIGRSSKDRDATMGYANGLLARGYKMHTICDENRLPLAWAVYPMNVQEQVAATELINQIDGPKYLTADNQYDVNRLYDLAATRNCQLVAPHRRRRAMGHRKHSPHRIYAQLTMPEELREMLRRTRYEIERFYGQLGNVGYGLGPLPNWVRTLPRVRRWVQMKLVLYLAGQLIRRRLAA